MLNWILMIGVSIKFKKFKLVLTLFHFYNLHHLEQNCFHLWPKTSFSKKS